MNQHFPAPTGGWNARDDFGSMPINDAINLRNIVPENGYCRARGGSSYFYDVADANFNDENFNSLYVYNDGANSILIACDDSNIWNASDPTTPVNLYTSSGGLFDAIMFNQKMILVNGQDTPQIYDGTATTADMVATLEDDSGVIGGISISDIIGVTSYKGRVYYWLDQEQRFFYADVVDAYQGTLKEFDISRVSKSGGHIVTMFTHARDTGSGLDDALVIIFDTGETVVYQGDDPGSVNDWSLTQRYMLSPLVGPRCVCQMGGDNLLITREGIINYSLAIQGIPASDPRHTGSKIVNAVTNQVKYFGTQSGWEINYLPESGFIIANVPKEGGEYLQYVMNTSTGAWCFFSGLQAITWIYHNQKLLFADSTGSIIEAESGISDLGDYVLYKAITAFSDMGQAGKWKKCTGVGITCNYPFENHIGVAVQTDFDQTKQAVIREQIEPSYLVWDVGSWNVDSWAEGVPLYGYEDQTRTYFYPAQGKGHNLAIKMKLKTKSIAFIWYNSIMRLKLGGRK